jgi:hypothetical protein
MGIDSWAGEPIYSLSAKIEEGMALCYIQEGGLGKVFVQPTVAGTDVFMGFAYSYFIAPATLVAVETYTVPSSVAYTVTLNNTPLSPTTDMLVKDSTGSTYVYNASPTGDEFSVSGATLTFPSTAAGAVVTVTYAYNPTVVQVEYLFGDGVAGQTTAAAVTGTIGLIRRGILYTSNFDPVVDWSTNPAMKVINGGLIGTGGSGASIPGYVVEVPSTDSPYLGINFSAT